jgi:KUP system potassium uptake protein
MHDPVHARSSLARSSLAALGIVFGDIGTSPLYALKETFNPARGIALNPETITGGVSAILWSIMIVVSLKYVVLIMRADNNGEGGVLALLALATTSLRSRGRSAGHIAMLGLIGLALFYGDAVLTPAISVLSAVEGLEIETAALKPYVLPIAVGVLIGLFMFQRHGTATVGALFGPVMIVWFIALAAAGVHGIFQAPAILRALDPSHGIAYVTQHGLASFLVLGAILLAFTGAEALYADMGHFGKGPIRAAWFALVLPALTLNYLGQGALVMINPEAVANPFYLLSPAWALLPLVVLATCATIIASQATISGAYSLTKQAIQLGYLPRMRIVHTSAMAAGQIYMPVVTWSLLAAVLAAVLGFGSSTNLASAYGVAVTGTMLIDTLLTFFVIRYFWHYNVILCVVATAFFALVDLAFFSSSAMKIAEGGWFPLSVGALMVLLMRTWRQGRDITRAQLEITAIELQPFINSVREHPPLRVPGTAVFMVANAHAVPRALLHNLAHNKVLHERVVILTGVTAEVPMVPIEERATVESLGDNFWRVTLKFGFLDHADVPETLQHVACGGFSFDMMDTTFFLSREKIVSVPGSGMAQWREHLYGTMVRNAGSAVDYFNLPANRVMEVGTHLEI